MNNFLYDIQWRKIKILIIVFSISLLLLIASSLCYFFILDDFNIVNKKLLSMQDKASLAEENSMVLADNLTALNTFHDKGFLGDPLRLEWVKSLQSIVAKHEIPSVVFTLNPTLSRTVDKYGTEQESYILRTPMVLEMKLMHEGDFYRLLTQLKEYSKGSFQVDFCEITRLDDDLRDSSTIEKLSAVCELTWFNYKDLRQEWFGNDV